MIAYCIFTAIVNAVTSLVLGALVYFRHRREPRNRVFTLFAANVAVWSGLYLLWHLAREPGPALLYCQCLSAAAILIPIAYFHFVVLLLNRKRPRHLLAGYALALALAALAFTPLMVARVEPRGGFPFWPVPGPWYPFYLAVFFYYVGYSVLLLVVGYRQSSGHFRNQLRYVLLGTSVGFAGGATNYFLWYGVPIPPVGNGLVALYVLGVGYAMARFRLMEFDLLLARALAYSAVVSVLALLVAAAAATGPYLSVGGSFMLTLCLTMLALGVLAVWGPSLRQRLDAFLEARVLRDRLSDRARLRRLAQEIGSFQDEEGIFAETAQAVAEALAVDRVALFLRFEFDPDFRRRASVGWPAGAEGESWSADQAALRRLLQAGPRAVLLDEALLEARDADREALLRLRRGGHLELAVPVFADTNFYGFIALGPRQSRGFFTETDIALLEAVGLQVGLNLRARQLERRAIQAEKLISLGTLAAGLAHEIRNPLVSIRTFGALIEEQGGDPEFRREFKAIVERDVRRINTIVENVSAFAENGQVRFAVVDVDEVIPAVFAIARPEFERAGVAFTSPPAGLPLVQGNYNQLLQVFLNLFQNAIHALDGRPSPRVDVSAEVVRRDDGGRTLVLAVADNGAGIDPALLDRVFEPFVTTKATGDALRRRGMGLGLALVKRIIDGHRGAIAVASEPGRGTTFFVHLPCLPPIP